MLLSWRGRGVLQPCPENRAGPVRHLILAETAAKEATTQDTITAPTDRREREETRETGGKDETEETAFEQALDESERVNEVDASRIMSKIDVGTGAIAIETGIAKVMNTARGKVVSKESAARKEQATEMDNEVHQAYTLETQALRRRRKHLPGGAMHSPKQAMVVSIVVEPFNLPTEPVEPTALPTMAVPTVAEAEDRATGHLETRAGWSYA